MPSRSAIPGAVRELFAARPEAVQELALAARRLVLTVLPEAIELPDAKASVVGYGYGTGYKDMVATIILSRTGVKIGLVQGASLPDPASLLKGAGKVHRYVEVRAPAHLRQPEVRQLLQAGLDAWRQRAKVVGGTGPRESSNVP